MCCGCWKEKGAPSTVTPEILLAADFIKANEDTLEFGPCHAIVGDANVWDEHLDNGRDACSGPDPWNRGPEWAAFWEKEQSTCRVAIMLLRSLEEEERVTVMGLVDGCFTPAD